jgi:2-oxoglutarate dehydrogenase E1 component
MFESWRAHPDSVDDSWKTYFRSIEERVRAPARAMQSAQSQSLQTQTDFSQVSYVEDQWRISRLVSAYRSLGHFLANIDPLGLRKDNQARLSELSLEYYGFTTDDMDRRFALGSDILPHFATQGQDSMTLREIIAACESVYCGNYGVEYQHIPDPEKRNWLRERLEVPKPINFSTEEKRRIFDSLVWTTTFDRFMAFKYPSEKRFGIAGVECLGPAMTSVIDQSADVHGIENIVIGSCHRGRLAMLGTVWGKPREAIFAEFDNRMISSLPIVTGDPKYHLGYNGQRTSPGGRDVSLNYLAIPSHLEAVDPVATGSAYATQRLLGDKDKTRAMCLALHGDAAFTGQGVVYETIGLARLDAYQVGGTVRILVNNQIGFTTDADASRSTPYASDIAKFVDAPIIHVNADDVEAVTFACRLAADWRARFHDDIVIDLVCYRKVGHNDIDQPSFTQPIMYKQIADQIPPLEQYIKKLVDEGTLTATEIEEQRKSIWGQINREFDASKNYEPERQNFPLGWDALPTPSDLAAKVYHQRPTAVQHATLKSIAEKANSAPPGFELHSNLQRVLAGRLSNFNKGSIDWSMAEALAFGSLCLEGHHVRLTGQDVQRGTFSQRHSVLHHQATGEKYVPLNDLAPSQGVYQASNSPLSEYGAMGFEYGVTLADPNSLVIWEAQFGDFTNNSQVVIDQFIFTGETKWLDRSGLVLSLPHGYDGQGAEHSSARLERFLMLCDGDGRSWPSEEALDRQHQDSNVSVVYMTSPANYFHVLRRQLSRDYRKRKSHFLRSPISEGSVIN